MGANIEACGCDNCKHEMCVSKVPIFSTLNLEDRNRVTSLIIRRTYAKGELIFMEGSNSPSMIIVNSGRVKTFRYTPEGKEQILNIFADGDFFGEMNLLRKSHKTTYAAEALSKTHVCMIHRENFQQLMREYPEIMLNIMEELCSRLEKMETMVQSLGSNDIDARISIMLLEFVQKYGKPTADGTLVSLPLSREGMANYVGITRETISRKLHHLQEEGILELIGNKKILIKDEESLHVLD